MSKATSITSLGLKASSAVIVAAASFAAFRRLRDALGPWAGRDDRAATFGERVAYYAQINLSDALFYVALAVLGASGCWLIAGLVDTSPSWRLSPRLAKWTAVVGLGAGISSGLLRQNMEYCLWISLISAVGALGVWALARVSEKTQPLAAGSSA